MQKDKLKYYLELLQIKEDADVAQIKTAYRNAAKIHHPDKSNNEGSAILFKEIKDARDILLNIREQNPKGSLIAHSAVVSPPKNRKRQDKDISYQDFLKSKKVWGILLVVTNSFLLIRIGFNTLITPLELLSLLTLFCSLSFLLYHKIKKYKLMFIAHFMLPFFLINVLLSINFMLSSKPVEEIHYFKPKITNDVNGIRIKHNESTLVELENRAYESYPGIRLHFDIGPLLFANAVKLQFETGIFGIKVLKNSMPISIQK